MAVEAPKQITKTPPAVERIAKEIFEDLYAEGEGERVPFVVVAVRDPKTGKVESGSVDNPGRAVVTKP